MTTRTQSADRENDERRQAEIVSRHLDPAYTADIEALSPPPESSRATQRSNGEDAEPESSLKLQGGDIHRDLYKITAKANPLVRAKTFSDMRRPSQLNATAAEHRQPGAFRRSFLQRSLTSTQTPVTGNFVSFLELYGAFAGEDLAESEDESAVDDDEHEDWRPRESGNEDGERRPLLGRRKSSRLAKKGDASTAKTFLLLLKSFVGTGVLFLPKAFKNGGILFSSITLIVVALVSCIAFHLLLQCRARYGGGYGDIGKEIGGERMRSIILASITFSQIGFVCAGIIFTAENMYSFCEAVGHSALPSIQALIGLQLIILIPMALIRNISKLGSAALLADVCILLGLGYIYYFDIYSIAKEGINKTVDLFNPRDFTLTVGSAIFTFEGIGLILPIQSSMKQPQKFEQLLFVVMLIVTIVYTSIGALSYATFGDKTTVEVISNFPQDSKLVNAVQFLYSLAILVGTPVQLFPAMRIIESSLFGHRSGKQNTTTKWKKNAFRAAIVVACGAISVVGAADLDKFVALIGSFACVPLVYIYPAYLHWKGIAENKFVKAGDILMIVVGLIAMIYTTVRNSRCSFSQECFQCKLPSGRPKFG